MTQATEEPFRSGSPARGTLDAAVGGTDSGWVRSGIMERIKGGAPAGTIPPGQPAHPLRATMIQIIEPSASGGVR